MIRRLVALVRRKPAPVAETKPAPSPLDETLRRIEESTRQTRERTDRLLERLRERERKVAS